MRDQSGYEIKKWLPTVDNLRNFFLTRTAEMLYFLQQVREALLSANSLRFASIGA
jgi:hypothetical protein